MVTRLNGFASGMDIDLMVKQLMAAQRAPLEKIQQKKQTLEWQRDYYRELNNKVLAFRNAAFDMKLQSPYLLKKTTSSDESIVTAAATANATDGVYKLRIAKLAESASANSSGAVTTVPGGNAVNVSNTIASVDASVASNFSLTVGGEKGTARIELSSTETIASFISKFNSKSTSTGVKVSFDDTMKRFFFVSSSTGKESKVELNSTDSNFLNNVLKVDGVTNNTGEAIMGTKEFMTTPPDAPDLDKLIDGALGADQSLRINYKGNTYDFTVTSTTTIGSLVQSINNNASFKATGIKVGLDGATGVLKFEKPNETDAISFSDMTSDGSNIVSQLGLSTTPNSSKTVSGASYLSPQPAYADSTKLINSGLTQNQTFRIKYDVDGDLTTEDYDFTITSTTTIGSLINSINSSALGKSGNVNAQLDAATGKLVLTTGDNTKHFDFSDATADGTNILSSLGLTAGVNDTAGAGDYSYSQMKKTGANAEIYYNDVFAEYTSNTFTINGTNFTAKKAAMAQDVNVVVNQDVDAVFNSIKSLVDKYNELTSSVDAKLTESKYRSFLPLTNAQREDMSENEITAWELKAKSGLLKNDSILSSAMYRFRSSLFETVKGLPNGDFSQLSDIGITTGSYLEKGKLYINESKLKEAIAANPEQVMNLFISNDGIDSSSSGDGLATRLYDLSVGLISTINSKAGSSTSNNQSYLMGKELDRIEESVRRFNDRLTSLENRYYKQFTAMETAMSKLSSQSSYLMQQFGGGQ
jgi:flagellar hook-associated protein 2